MVIMMKFIYTAIILLCLNTALFASKKCHRDWAGDLICEEKSFSDSAGDFMGKLLFSSFAVRQENAKKLNSVIKIAKPPKNNNWSGGLVSKEPMGQ